MQSTVNLPRDHRSPLERIFYSQQFYGYLFIFPTVAFFVLFIAIPFFRAIGISFTDWRGYGETTFVGLRNFSDLLDDRIFWLSLRHTLAFTFVTTVLQTIIPLLVAVLLNAGWRGSVFFRTAVFIPQVISFVVSGLLWRMIYDPTFGVLNTVLTRVGLEDWTRPWLASPETVMPAIIVVSLWQSLGFYMLIFFAGLQSIPEDLYEVASLDGASSWRKLKDITVPMLWPVTSVVLVLNLIGGIKVFDIIYVMTTGGPNHASEVLGTYLYVTAFGSSGGGSGRLGYASAIGVVILVLALVGALIQQRVVRGRTDVY